MKKVYLPLPYIPIDSLAETPSIITLIATTGNNNLQIGQKYLVNSLKGSSLTTHVSNSFEVIVVGLYQEQYLAIPIIGRHFSILKKDFFSENSRERYKKLSKAEYESLYPDESKLLPTDFPNFRWAEDE